MSSVKRVYVEKKPEFAVAAKGLFNEMKGYLGVAGLENVRVLIRYDIENLSEETFVTDFNRRVFSLILKKEKATGEVGLSALADELTPEEMGKIAGLLAKSRELGNTKQQLLDSVRVLKDLREQLRPNDLKDGGEDELKRFYEQQKQKKSRR